METEHYDVIVVGGGNAALTAALSAIESGAPDKIGGAKVLVLEKAPKEQRGGNTYFTGGGFRCCRRGVEDIVTLVPDLTDKEIASLDLPPYTEVDFYGDLMHVTEGLSDPDLAQAIVSQSYPTMRWMAEQGIRWEVFMKETVRVGDKIRPAWGRAAILGAHAGGKGLCDMLFAAVEKKGARVLYGIKALKLNMDEYGRVTGLVAKGPGGFLNFGAGAVVLAAGGFQANVEMRTKYLGAKWSLVKVRGTKYNTGDGLRMALEVGAQPYGDWGSCHATEWDINAPPFGDREITDMFGRHEYPLGIMVNIKGERFVDEGADVRNFTYAKYGREILNQPEAYCFQIYDSKIRPVLREDYNIGTSIVADSITELARKAGLDPQAVERTVREYNAAIQPGEFNRSILDGKHTKGIAPPKSNWSLPIDSPPFYGYPVTCGITFTFGGVRISTQGQVLDTEDNPIPGLYSAGEMVGGIFYHNYAGGSGLTAGAVFGKIAGASAAVEARSRAAVR